MNGAKRPFSKPLQSEKTISQARNMSQQRGISRVVNVPPATPGFVGPGHLADAKQDIARLLAEYQAGDFPVLSELRREHV